MPMGTSHWMMSSDPVVEVGKTVEMRKPCGTTVSLTESAAVIASLLRGRGQCNSGTGCQYRDQSMRQTERKLS